jgi:hypothetical protein
MPESGTPGHATEVLTFVVWIALAVLSFNPIVWIINSIYLWKRWTEGPGNMATV